MQNIRIGVVEMISPVAWKPSSSSQPAVLEDQDQRAERRADREQRHEDRLQRQEDRAEGQQQDQVAADDHEEQRRQRPRTRSRRPCRPRRRRTRRPATVAPGVSIARRSRTSSSSAGAVDVGHDLDQRRSRRGPVAPATRLQPRPAASPGRRRSRPVEPAVRRVGDDALDPSDVRDRRPPRATNSSQGGDAVGREHVARLRPSPAPGSDRPRRPGSRSCRRSEATRAGSPPAAPPARPGVRSSRRNGSAGHQEHHQDRHQHRHRPPHHRLGDPRARSRLSLAGARLPSPVAPPPQAAPAIALIRGPEHGQQRREEGQPVDQRQRRRPSSRPGPSSAAPAAGRTGWPPGRR